MNGFGTLWKYRWRAALHTREILRQQSLFKVLFVTAFAVGLIAGLWGLFAEALSFLDKLGGVGLVVIPKLFSLFFFGLSLMLALSGVLASYTTLFRSEETSFLLLNPLTDSEILLFKYLESAFYSSWAFFFIIIPFVGAYAGHERLPWHFTVWMLGFAIPYVLLFSGVGFVVALVFVRWAPRRGLVKWTLWGIAGALLAWTVWGSGAKAVFQDDATLVLTRFIPGLKLASWPLLPSWWVAEGILSFSRGQWQRGFLLWGTLASSALLVALLVDTIGRRIFYDGLQRMLAGDGRIRRCPVLLQRLDRAMARVLAPDLRCLSMKDIRIFLRDPQQWMQALIFFGLLGLYFLNLRKFNYHLLPPEWRNLIAFLNIFSTAAVLCSMGARFIYPQMSLEGQAFWAIGMAPTSMGRVLAAKFLLAAAAMLAVSLGLVWVGARMLDLAPLIRGVTLVIIACVALAVAGLSTGLGAIFLDLRQRNPSAIVSSFGGTLNLVLSLGFMLAAIVPFGVLFHLWTLGHLGDPALYKGLAAALAGLAILTTAATLLPLRLAQHSLSIREY